MASRKRARADTAGSSIPQLDTNNQTLSNLSHGTVPTNSSASATIPEYDLRTALEAIPPKEIIETLITLSSSNPHIATWARTYYHCILGEERAKVINFDHFSKTVWHEINTKCARMKSSQQYEASFEVAFTVERKIRSIASQVKEDSSWGTKKSAMETLRKIAKTICLSGDCIGSEVRKQFQHNDALTVSMLHVVNCMSIDERVEMCNVDDGRGPFSGKMEELAKECKSHYLCKGMDDVLDMLIGPELEEDDDKDQDDEDEEENE